MSHKLESDSPESIRAEALSRRVAYDRHQFLEGQDAVRFAMEQVKLFPDISPLGRNVIQDAISLAVIGALKAQAAIYDGPPTTREKLEELARTGNGGDQGDLETDKQSLVDLHKRFKI